MNKLTASIFRSLFYQNIKDNFVFSPASYLEAINNLCLCLNGDNLKEVLDKLEIQESDLFNYIKEYKANLSLESYNTLLYSQEYWAFLNQETIKNIQNLGANLESLNFNDAASTVNRVNSLVSEKTHNKINNLISPQDIPEFTKFIILNCVYFNKNWLHEFEEKSFEEPFYGHNNPESIKFLYKTNSFEFYEDSELDIVELPYKDSDICCYLFVPAKDRNVFDLLSNFENNYNKINLIKNDCQVNLTVPPFKIESTFDLKQASQVAGLNSIFNWNKDWNLVDFNKLNPEATLKVDKIIQKTYFDFTKKGTEAAAATAILIFISGCMMGGFITPPRIKYILANKPFIYVLANKKNKNEPLFIGVLRSAE